VTWVRGPVVGWSEFRGQGTRPELAGAHDADVGDRRHDRQANGDRDTAATAVPTTLVPSKAMIASPRTSLEVSRGRRKRGTPRSI
jgi:hypothetical protein